MQERVGEATQYLEESAVKIEGFEGRVHWLYLDGAGLVTVGVGRMLPNLEAAQALPFQTRDGRPATMQEIAQDFERVRAMEPNHLPTYYLSAASVRMGDADIEALLFATVSDVDTMLRQSFLRYGSWPKSARLATIDMLYNLGHRHFMMYKKMIGALMQEDWATAARECGRNLGDAGFAERNYWTRSCFLDAQIEAGTAIQKAS